MAALIDSLTPRYGPRRAAFLADRLNPGQDRYSHAELLALADKIALLNGWATVDGNTVIPQRVDLMETAVGESDALALPPGLPAEHYLLLGRLLAYGAPRYGFAAAWDLAMRLAPTLPDAQHADLTAMIQEPHLPHWLYDDVDRLATARRVSRIDASP